MIKINYGDISFTANIKSVLTNTLERKLNGPYYGLETINGLKMALEYLESVNVEQLTELQLKHAIRLSRYRGKETNYRTLTTA